MTTNEVNKFISHLKRYGDGSPVINIFGVLKTKPITLNELRKLYFAKLRHVHPDKMPALQKKIATECTKKIREEFKMVERYAQQKAKKNEIAETDILITPDLFMFCDQDKEDHHLSIFVNGSIDICNMKFLDEEDKKDETFISTRDGMEEE